MTPDTKKNSNVLLRQPIVAVMGHIDHGKSTLLDYIRKTHITKGEAGGITQHISAYEAEIKDESGKPRQITFLDTPGHEAFSSMRKRGVNAADIAILVVAANDGVKAQTKEAYEAIKQSGIPLIVAINKIDLPEADVSKTKNSLVENGIYIEGYGGNIPAMEISSKSGTGIDELLAMIILVSELSELSYNPSLPASGVVLEANIDGKKGISATLIVKDGVLKSGEFVVAGRSFAPTRMIEDYAGEKITEAHAGRPIKIIGFDDAPQAGERFESVTSKKEAEKKANEYAEIQDAIDKRNLNQEDTTDKKIIPIVVKADTAGTRDAILDEIKKIEHERIIIRILDASTGTIGENDVSLAGSTGEGIVVGFHTKPDTRALKTGEDMGVLIKTFDIIYELVDWIKETVESMAPKFDVEEAKGKAKVLKIFSQTKRKEIIGVRLEEGTIKKNDTIKIIRRENEIGKATVLEVRKGKEVVTSASAPDEIGIRVESKLEISPGDYLEPFMVVKK